MARIPTVGGRNVRERALQGGMDRGSPVPAAFEGNSRLARGIEDATSKLATATDRIADRKAREETWRIEQAVQTEFNEFDMTQRKNRKGVAAANYHDDVERFWEEAKSRHLEGVSNRARQELEPRLEQARLRAVSGAAQFADRQMSQAEAESYTAAQSIDVQRASTAGDPIQAEATLDTIRERVAERGAAEGWTTERMISENLKWQDQLHRRMIDSLMQTDPPRAREYFEKHRDQVDSQFHSRVENALTDVESTFEARGTVDVMLAQNMSFGEMTEQVRNITDDDVRSKARQFVRQAEQDRRTAEANQEKDATDAIWHRIANGAERENLPAGILSQLPGKERQRVEKYFVDAAEARAKIARGEAIETHPEVERELMRIMEEEPDRFRELDLEGQYRPYLSNDDLLEFQQEQRELQNPEDTQTLEQVFKDIAIGEAELVGTDNEVQRRQFRRKYYDRVHEFRKENARAPTRQEAQTMGRQLLLEGTLGRARLGPVPLWKRTGFMFEAENPEEEARVLETTEIPDADREHVKRRLEQVGVTNPTESEIREMYTQLLGTSN